MVKGKVQNLLNKQNGITLVALVVTIVILIILAVVSINAIFGDNGLIKSAQKGKLEQEKAEARERLSLVLADAYAEKHINEKYNQDEFLDEFIYAQEPDAEVDEVEISLNGHTFELDRSVPQLGDYIGEAGNLPPVIRRIDVTNKTLSEISVKVTSARAEGATYKYSIKKLEEDEGAYVEKEGNGGVTYTFIGLTSPEKYTIKVDLVIDGEIKNSKTADVVLGELEEGTIKFGPVTWPGVGTASTTITTSTSYQLQYQIVSEENKPTDGGWQNILNAGTIQNIPNKSSVYGRLVEGTNTSDYAVLVVKDEIKPTINSFEAIETTSNSIKVQVSATDNESGLSSRNTYKFYLDDEETEKGTSTDGTFTYENLSGLTGYKLRVEVYDNAGNAEESTINVTTKEVTIEDALDISDNQKVYVEIPNKKDPENTILCNVLYNDETNGLQIISVSTIETVYLSGIDQYNDVINILNAKAEEYNYFGSKYVEARCVGCRPVKDEYLGYESGTGETNWWGHTMKNTDENYSSDYNKMTALGIASTNNNYWLASRIVGSGSGYSNFIVRYVSVAGALITAASVGRVYNNSNTSGGGYPYGLRPVFTLKSGIKITGGDGSYYSPYSLGV